MSGVHAHTLQRAAQVVGGIDRLSRHLGASLQELRAWMSGEQEAPVSIFLAAVDLISSRGLAATHFRDSILSRREPASAFARRPVLQFLGERFLPSQGKEMAEAALDAALSNTGAVMANLQLACPDGLRIGAQRGFEEPFLEFFDCVDDESSACGKAMKAGRRIVVGDVASDPIFAGSAAGEAMAQAGARAVQSTPIFAASGWLLGVLSTHYDRPHHPSEDELQVIDRVASRTAFWLEGGAP